MKASELIILLQKQIEVHGDLNVVIRGYDGEFDVDWEQDVPKPYFDEDTQKLVL